MSQRAHRGYLSLRGQPAQAAFVEAAGNTLGVTLPLTPNTVVDGDDLSVMWMAPNEWLIVMPADAVAALQDKLRTALDGLFAAVVDVSSGYATIELQGTDARALIARGCGVDLHPRSFGVGDCAQTLLAKASVLIVAIDETPCFHVIVRRSLAVYLWRWLDDARRDVLSVPT